MPSDINLGGLQLHLYSVFFALGLGLGYFIALKFAKRLNVSEELVDSLALVLLVSGILGARFFYVAGHWGYYQNNLVEMLQFWRGGLAFYGALIGGAVGLTILWFYKKFSLLRVLDVLAPALAAGQAVGRLGNYFNREAFGPPTDLPWKMFVPENLRPADFLNKTFFHPVFLYESLGLLIIFFILYKLSKNAMPAGGLFAVYALSSGILRFSLEFLRLDALVLGGLKISQLAAILVILIGVILLYRNASKAV